MVVTDKFRVEVGRPWKEPWPKYFDNFWNYCTAIAHKNGWAPITVANYQLRPLNGKLIQTSTQGWYLRWDKEETHTFFVLKWS